MNQQEEFVLYIPASKRPTWMRFRERVENEGKPVSDVIMELVDGYLGEKE